MKKLILVLIAAIFIGGAAYGQAGSYGKIYNFVGLEMPLSGGGDNEWLFNVGGLLGAKVSSDKVDAFVEITAGDQWRGNATVKLDKFALSIGDYYLPWERRSSILFLHSENFGFGASNSLLVAYITFNISDFYFGVTGANRIHGISTDRYPFPGIYLGYDHNADKFSAGFAAAGLMEKTQDAFSWMAKGHAKFKLDACDLGVNLALYGAPQYGFFALVGSIGTDATSIATGKDALVLEAMVDLSIPLEKCSLGLSGALIANFAEDSKGGGGSAMQIGFDAKFPLAESFYVIPGVIVRSYLKGRGGADISNTYMQFGVTMLYNF